MICVRVEGQGWHNPPCPGNGLFIILPRTMPALLTEDEITTETARLASWQRTSGKITRRFKFPDFKTALQFVNAVSVLAEEANHHPDIDIRWNEVLLCLSTHSKGGLTKLDFDLAEKINTLP